MKVCGRNTTGVIKNPILKKVPKRTRLMSNRIFAQPPNCRKEVPVGEVMKSGNHDSHSHIKIGNSACVLLSLNNTFKTVRNALYEITRLSLVLLPKCVQVRFFPPKQACRAISKRASFFFLRRL